MASSMSLAVAGSRLGGVLGIDAGEVGADLLPALAAVAGAEDELVGVVEGFVVRGEDLRERPGLAVGVGGVGRGQFAAE